MNGSGIDRLKQLSDQLAGLMNDPQPGLRTWGQCLYEVLKEISLFVSPERNVKEPS
jgi:hypothetical protein